MNVPISRPLLGKTERKYVTDAITKGDISGAHGTYLKEFENSFAKFCGVRYVALVNSGTTALHVALASLDIKKGDEVIVPDLTMMATFFAVLYQGATPVTVDSEPDTGNIDPSLIERSITKRTKAIIVVHLYGHPADMDPIMKIAKKYKLRVIEDAAEAHGALYKGKRVGSIGDLGCFSFYSNKVITTGEGGAVISNNKALMERVNLIKNLSFGKKQKLMHESLGFKYQMTNLQAAVGAGQMTHVDNILKRKRAIGAYFLKHLSGIPEIELPLEKPYAWNVYWMFRIVLKGKLSGKRAQFMQKLAKRGVDTREDFVPFNQQKFAIKEGLAHPKLCPVAKSLGENGLYIPSGTDIAQKELAYVVEQVRAVVKEIVS